MRYCYLIAIYLKVICICIEHKAVYKIKMLCKRCYTTRLSYLILNKCVLIFIYNNILTSKQSIFLNSFKINVLINYIIVISWLISIENQTWQRDQRRFRKIYAAKNRCISSGWHQSILMVLAVTMGYNIQNKRKSVYRG